MDIPKDIIKLIEVNKYLRSIKTHYQELYNEVGEYDKETCDCLHDLEFTKFYRTGGHRRARHLKAIRQARRKCKDEMELIAPLKEYLDKNPSLTDDISQVIGRIRQIHAKQAVRIYTPRIKSNEDMFNGKHFDENENNDKKITVKKADSNGKDMDRSLASVAKIKIKKNKLPPIPGLKDLLKKGKQKYE